MALTTPFAQNGDKKAIPENTTGDGSLSYETGFGGFYALPPEEGGLFIDRAQFNQLMYDTTSAVITNQNNINTLNSKFTSLEQPINITLGDNSSGAQFQTLDAALAEAGKYFGDKSVTITLLSDITINKSYNISPVSSMISFVSNDDTKHTINFDTGAQLNFWGGRFRFNKINFKTTQSNITISRALNTAVGVFEQCGFDGANTAIVCRNSFLGIITCEFTNIVNRCLYNYRNGVVDFAYSIINANVVNMVYQSLGGTVNIQNTTINTPFTGAKYNIAANTITKDGIIFDNN